MILKPPSPEKGDVGIETFRADAKLYEDTLKNRTSRALYRGDLTKCLLCQRTMPRRRPEIAVAVF